jgi:FkbM family methyltransferase
MTPIGELILQTAYKSNLPWLPSAALRLFPQPGQYSKATVRMVERDGALWELRPAHFFQWARYFGIDDPVKRGLLEHAVGCRTIIDVGANIGYYSICLAKLLGNAGTVLALEPNAESFSQLRMHCEMNDVTNVVAVRCAASDIPGESVLRDHGVGDLGKFSLRRSEAERDTAGPCGQPVPVETVDRLCLEHGLRHVDLIKVDVEGYETEVLLGAGQILRRDKPILVLEWSPHWHQEPEKAKRCIQLLLECGYDHWLELVASGPALEVQGLEALSSANDRAGQSNWLAWAGELPTARRT